MDLKMALSIAVTVLAGCGGAAFSTAVPANDAGSGDVAPKTDGDDAETGVSIDAGADAATEPSEAASASDAAPEAASPACLSTLNGVGTGDFRISFTMTSISTQELVPLVNQKAGCNQTSVWWQALVDGHLGGKIVFNMCDVTGPGSCPTGPTVYTSNPVDDGQPHRIVIDRISGVISISSDGVAGTTSPDTYSFETFGAPVTIGTDDCGDPPLVGYGALTDFCITTQ